MGFAQDAGTNWARLVQTKFPLITVGEGAPFDDCTASLINVRQSVRNAKEHSQVEMTASTVYRPRPLDSLRCQARISPFKQATQELLIVG